MYKSILLVMGLLLYTGCSVTSPHAKLETKAPKWYYNPPKDDIYDIYGVGEGETSQAAILDALAAINNKFGVNVSVNYRREMTYDTSISGNEKTKVNKYIEASSYLMEFSNYEVVSTFERKDNVVVLVKIDKIKYTDFIKQKVEKEINELKEQENHAKNSNYIMKTRIYEDLNVRSKQLEVYIKVYRQILGLQNRLSREARYLRVLNENYLKIVNNKNINVVYKGKSPLFKENFEIFLSENKFNIRTSKQNLKVVVDTTIKYKQQTKMSTYEHKITILEHGDVIKNVVFNVIEYGLPKDNILLARKHFTEEINSLVLK